MSLIVNKSIKDLCWSNFLNIDNKYLKEYKDWQQKIDDSKFTMKLTFMIYNSCYFLYFISTDAICQNCYIGHHVHVLMNYKSICDKRK
jgi:hypothetical protein